MRVLFLPRWYPDKNDVQNAIFIRKHAQAVALQHEVDVLYVTPDPHAERSLEVEHCKINGVTEYFYYYKPSSLPLIGRVINIVNYSRYTLRAFITLSKRNPYKLLHVHMMTRTGVMAFLIKYFWNIPYVITEHWTGYIDHKFKSLSSLKKRIMKVVIQQASGISVVSPSLKEGMLQLGLENTYTIIPNVVEALPGPPVYEKDLSPRKKLLTVADFYDPKKNISGIIHALGPMAQKRSDFELHLIGDGPDRDIIEAAIKQHPAFQERVFLHGRLGNRKVLEHMQEAHLYICFSNVETFSVTTAEALAAGKPVICTACGGPEYFVEETMGIILPKNDQKGLRKAVEQLLDHSGRFDPKQIKQKMEQKFSILAVGKAFDRFYQQCLTGDKSV